MRMVYPIGAHGFGWSAQQEFPTSIVMAGPKMSNYSNIIIMWKDKPYIQSFILNWWLTLHSVIRTVLMINPTFSQSYCIGASLNQIAVTMLMGNHCCVEQSKTVRMFWVNHALGFGIRGNGLQNRAHRFTRQGISSTMWPQGGLRRFLQEGKVELTAEAMPDFKDSGKPKWLPIIITSSCAEVTAAAL